MPINKETIISVFDEKLTLMQWLKTINKALEDAVLTGVTINKKGNATLSFVFTFEDGTTLETDDLILQQGESINGATIRNGHLYLSLTNGDELDAGNLKPVTSFTINASQHLIVNYGDGTSQDLGAIFSGNVNIDGILNATKVTGDEIVENMTGYTFVKNTSAPFTYAFAGVSKNGNKLTFVIAGVLNTDSPTSLFNVGSFVVPEAVANKIVPLESGTSQVAFIKTTANTDYLTYVDLEGVVVKDGTRYIGFRLYPRNVTPNINYKVRIEMTFLLSDNLATE